MSNATDQVVKELERKHPAWQIWVVNRIVGGPLYCARRWDETGCSLNADDPAHLSEYIEEAEAG